MPGLAPKLPLNVSPTDGYNLVKTMPELIRQNLKNLLMTIPGERVMDPLFGVGIKKYLFEQNVAYQHQIIKTDISKQVKKYMPFISLQEIKITQEDDGNTMFVQLFYMISPLNQTDSTTIRARR